ncbi:hypothetical protein HanHA89_Chr02g0045351 [Helianthus annuus]|nr:hypothetical protein HanHA89_Chr02g0045351 [Helianthus annuus]
MTKTNSVFSFFFFFFFVKSLMPNYPLSNIGFFFFATDVFVLLPTHFFFLFSFGVGSVAVSTPIK